MVRILLIDNGTNLLNELKELIPGSEVTVAYDELGGYDVASFDRIVLSGSSIASVVWDKDAFLDEVSVIRRAHVPVIGLCFGCELIAHAFGATLRKMEYAHKGIRSIQFSDERLTTRKSLDVYEHHRWIIDHLPESFEVLAYSDDGPEAIKHKSRPLYGLQFHPERCGEDTETRAIFMRLLLSPLP